MNSALLYLKSFFQVLKLTDIIDIFLIALIVYQLLKILKETRAMQLVKGIFVLFLILQVSSWAHLNTLNYLKTLNPHYQKSSRAKRANQNHLQKKS